MRRISQKILLITAILSMPLHAVSTVYTGDCGTMGSNVTYEFDTSSGILTISGNGYMKDWPHNFPGDDAPANAAPWAKHKGALKHCIIKEGVKGIGKRTFMSCNRLMSAELPAGLETIGDSAFWYCQKLSELTLPNSIKSIGLFAFYYTAIEHLEISDSIENIPRLAFRFCKSLKSVKIPGHALKFYPIMFDGERRRGNYELWEHYGPKLEKLILTGDSIDAKYLSSSRITGADYYSFSPGSADTIIIQDAKYLPGRTPYDYLQYFENAKALYINMSKSDGKKSLNQLPGLKYLAYPFNNIELLGACIGGVSNGKSIIQYKENGDTENYSVPSGLEEVVVAEGTTQIAYGCLSNFSMLKKLTLPSTLNGIKDKALYGCDGLTDIYVKRALPPVAYSGTFEGINLFACTLHVPHGSKKYYEKATGWKDFYLIEEEAPISITVTKNIENGGEIVGLKKYQPGTTAELQAIANSGYVFSAWTENGNIMTTADTYTFTVTADRQLLAVFTPVANSGNIGTTAGPTTVHFTWSAEPGAAVYTLNIYEDTEMTRLTGSQRFDAEGSPMSPAALAPLP